MYPCFGDIKNKYYIQFHCHANNTQLYLPISQSDQASLATLQKCLADIKSWMSDNFLQVSDKESEAILSGPRSANDWIENDLGPMLSNQKPTARNLASYSILTSM